MSTIRPSTLPPAAAWVFGGFGALMVVSGSIMAFDEPGGFALAAFGAMFAGVGLLVRKMGRSLDGNKTVVVSERGHDFRPARGGRGSRRVSVSILVDENASEAEVAAARADWFRRQFERRSDWVSGRVEEDGSRNIVPVTIATCVMALGSAGLFAVSAFVDEWWLWPALGFAAFTLLLAFGAVRKALHRRKFGRSIVELEQSPLRVGQPLVATVRTGVPASGSPPVFRLCLECVHDWEEIVGSGKDRDTRSHRDVLWSEAWEAQAEVYTADDGAPRLSLSIDRALPRDQPGASFGSDRIDWELSVHASLPGLDHRSSFGLPIFDESLEPVGPRARA